MDVLYYYSWNLLGLLENLFLIFLKFILYFLFFVRKYSFDIFWRVVLFLNLYYCVCDVRYEIFFD